jgi:hypothetical protein
MKKIQIPGLNTDIKGTTPERIREEGTVSKQSYGVSISSRDKVGVLNESQRKTAGKKVIMHVNHYIPFFMQYHALSSSCLSEFAKDY